MTNYLEVKNLSKSFDSFQLHNISFTLPKGYIMGLIGPNGSGKSNISDAVRWVLGEQSTRTQRPWTCVEHQAHRGS